MRTLKEEAVAQLVLSRLSGDSRTFGQTIDVVVNENETLLLGSCDSPAQKAAAKMIALGTYGVHTVSDRLTVRALRRLL